MAENVNFNVSSPCINQCKLNSASVCLGCGRTSSEIANWSRSTCLEKQNILKRLNMKQIDQVIKNVETNLKELKKIREDYSSHEIKIVEYGLEQSAPNDVCAQSFIVEEGENTIKVIIN